MRIVVVCKPFMAVNVGGLSSLYSGETISLTNLESQLGNVIYSYIRKRTANNPTGFLDEFSMAAAKIMVILWLYSDFRIGQELAHNGQIKCVLFFEVTSEFCGFSKICGHELKFAAILPQRSLRALYQLFTFSQLCRNSGTS